MFKILSGTFRIVFLIPSPFRFSASMLSIFVTFLFQHSWTEMSSILFYKALIAVRNTRPWHCMFPCICILYIKKETLDIKLAIHPKLHGSNTFTKWNTNISWKWQYQKGKKKQLFVLDTLYIFSQMSFQKDSPSCIA